MADTTPHGPATDGHGAASSPTRTLVHWVKLISGAIVGLAALLAAIAVIVDLLDKDPVPVVGAEFAPLELTATTLDDFQATQKFTSTRSPRVRLEPAAASTTLAQEPPGEEGEGGTTSTEEPQSCPSLQEVRAGAEVPQGCPAGGEPCPTASEVSELGVEVPEGCPSPGLDCPDAAEVARNATVPEGCPIEGLADAADPDDAKRTSEELNQQYDMGRGCSGDPAGSRCALNQVARSAGGIQAGSRAESLVRVREVLAGTRTKLGRDGKRRPMGMMVSFDVTVRGLSGERLDVFWSMLSADSSRPLDQSWLRNTRAATLRPSATTDQLQKDLWLPLPKQRGRYRARVTLLDERGRRFSKRSGVFH
ncbi:MAG TPA: hypothetical protein VKA57_10235 [Solirubrobacteraceae bacterium]|nr:hypothetical protein [Solirubrobacteraceae bacterium]